MRIRKLDLHGFKSFPDRTTLHFGAGVSVVVGPNGCGKSNLVDAIKWCVGEQSAKSLRGDEMADVIFAGSADRQPVGFAEVTMTFTSEGGEPFPGEYARFTEVSIGRKLYRDGTSEYLINGARVRRKDVIDLFLDTGVGDNLYSFIEQGRIGEIVHASPERRRLLIDEAAGITRYKIRRDEAQDRLEETATQLDRVSDVTDEMAHRRGVLEAQVLYAARFRRLRALVRQREIFLGLARLAERTAERREVGVALRELRNEHAATERDVTRREADVTQRREEVDLVDAAITAWRDEHTGADGLVRDLEGELGWLDRTARESEDDLARERGGLAEAESERAAAELEVQAATDRGEALALELDQRRVAITAARIALAFAADARRTGRTLATEAEQAVAAIDGRLAAADARIEDHQRRLDGIPGRRARLEVDVAGADADVATAVTRGEQGRLTIASRQRAVDVAKDVAQRARAEADAAEGVERDALAAVDAREERAAAARVGYEAEIDVTVAAIAVQEAKGREIIGAMEARAAAASALALRAATERVDLAQRAAREAIRVAEAEAAGAIAAARAAEAQASRALEEALAVADRAAEAFETTASREAEVAGQARVGATESAGRARVADVIAEAEASRVETTAAADAARDAVERGEAAVVAAIREQQELEGRLRGLEAAVADERSGMAGGEALAQRFPGLRPLVDHLGADAAPTPGLASRLDERWLMPVVSTDLELVAVAEALRTAGRASVLRIDGIDALLACWDEVDDLSGALAHTRATGRGAVVRGTGERVEPDGVVRIGATADVAAAALRRRQELAAVRERVTRVEAQLGALRAALGVSLERAAQAREAAAAAVAWARAVGLSAEEEVRSQIRAVEADEQARRETRMNAHRAAREARRVDRDQRLAATRVALAAETTAAEAHARARLQAVRDAAESSAESVRVAAATAVESARAIAATEEASERSRVDAALTDARVGLDALRRAAGDRERVARGEVEALRRVADQARGVREEAERAVGRLHAEVSAAEVALARAEGDLATALAAEDRARARRVGLEADRDALAVELAELAAARATLADERAALGLERQSRHGDALRARSSSDAAEAAEGQAVVGVATEEVAIRGLEERASAAAEIGRRSRLRSEEAAHRSLRARTRMDELELAATGRHRRRAEVDVELLAAQVSRDEANGRWVRDRERAVALKRALRDHETALRVATERRDDLARQVIDLDGRLREVQADVEAVCDRAEERYQVSLTAMLDRLDVSRALPLEPDPGLRDGVRIGDEAVPGVGPFLIRPDMLTNPDRIEAAVGELDELRSELGAFGEVNLAAVDEYTDLAGRHDELLRQRADLEASVEGIRSAIAKMNKTCRERFREAFDRVNENFQVAYPRLVGGGSARLALTDDEDILETGVDIFVQPPGKRLQNLTLLSGGEKAMAAIALLLALFQVKPSPFCLLDEVDAPLDEANGARFNDMLREMCMIAQFIVITHNRKTIEAADTLYGITMPTPGVSRLVSVRLGS